MSMKKQGEREKLGIFTHSFVKDVFKNALKNFNPSGGFCLEMKGCVWGEGDEVMSFAVESLLYK